ncbi:hypothetical protein [Paractinoplanes durhamensis]|uniref:Uncharacterized protein n=1 Tax=Paractinoplanes durhamensis TaxID=113563 RepID=A0ABQ3ZCZ8_9ACTN|nr:hypothetical protein [Actinoplanes durhamensis]GIE07712.1 hypothetical protein Adu01nite_90620 [Actinoplanes durhamensis]
MLVAVLASAAVVVAGSVAVSAHADVNSAAISAAATSITAAPNTGAPITVGTGSPSGNVPLSSSRVIKITADFSSAKYRKVAINEILSEARNKGIGVYMQQTLAALPAHAPFQERFLNTQFNGSISMSNYILTVTVTKGEVTTQVNWWQTTIANLTAFVALVTTYGLCAAAFPAAGFTPFCGGLSGGVAELVKDVILQGFDHKLASAEEWGNTLVNVLVSAGLSAFGEAALKWGKNTIPTLLNTVAQSVKNFGVKLSAAWGAIRGVTIESGDYLFTIIPFVRSALSRVVV